MVVIILLSLGIAGVLLCCAARGSEIEQRRRE
jgi:hypothetical protein